MKIKAEDGNRVILPRRKPRTTIPLQFNPEKTLKKVASGFFYVAGIGYIYISNFK